MTDALTLALMSPQLRKVAERAQREPDGQFHALAHLLDERALHDAYLKLRPEAAVGVDGVTHERYGRDLQANLHDLHQRLKSQRYRHQPIQRVHIPKEGGKTRPLGLSTVEDKIVQEALRAVLEAVYEQDFLDCSYGFRPGRGAHDALRALHRAEDRGELNWVLEADIQSFFDSVNHKHLLELLQQRVPDGSLSRLVAKCLHAGVLDGETYVTPEAGTAQGSILSPLLGNVYLHYVLDRWFEREVKPCLRGRACLVRYADDFVIGFERQDDAERVQAVLGKRLARYGLTLHPDKTRLLDFRAPSRDQQSGKGPGTFDFLGFTLYQRRTRAGRWRLACKTRRSRLRRSLLALADWCRRQRHRPLAVQCAALTRRLRGHYAYFGVNGNARSLNVLHWYAKRAWRYWLCRRSQRAFLPWQRFLELLRSHPLPAPRIVVQLWGP